MSQPPRRYDVRSALRRPSLRVDPAAARALVAEGALLVDVRRKDDRLSPLGGATRVAPDEIPAFARGLPPGIEIVLACT